MQESNEKFIIDNKILNNFKIENKSDQNQIIFIILNYEINYNLIQNMKLISDIILVGDGGANRLYKIEKNMEKKLIPQCIIGDMDSIENDIQKFYQGKGSQIIKSDCQDSTDLDKVMNYFDNNIKKNNMSYNIYVTGALGGRIDHTLTNLSNLQKYQMKYYKKQNILFQLLDEHSLCTCLMPGESIYQKSQIEREEGVGVFSLSKPDFDLKTNGLKWDIDQEIAKQLNFGSFLSSSNAFNKEIVEINNTQPIIFTSSIDIEKADIQNK